MKQIRVLAAIAMFTMCSMGLQAQETAEMVYPQAEWSKAGDILMHTPGQELFNGIIHPSAGLFEKYFDVDKAAEEHRGYISMLEKNGIRVHTVLDILDEVGIDSLKALAEKVLIDGYGAAHCMTQVLQREAWKNDASPTAIRSSIATSTQEQPAYRLSGTIAKDSDRGIIIQNGKKSVR